MKENGGKENISNKNLAAKLPSNPFDMIGYSSKQVKAYVNTPSSQPDFIGLKDEKILSLLKKDKNSEIQLKKKHRNGIFSKIKIISYKEMSFNSIKLYKFPFDINIRNDDSESFNIIFNNYLSALSSVYSNFRRFEEPFKIQIDEEIIFFDEELKTTKGLEKMLINSDVDFIETGTFLTIDRSSLPMLYDMLLNLDIPKNGLLPFILSHYEFENGILYHIKIEKGPIIKGINKIEHSKDLQYF